MIAASNLKAGFLQFWGAVGDSLAVVLQIAGIVLALSMAAMIVQMLWEKRKRGGGGGGMGMGGGRGGSAGLWALLGLGVILANPPAILGFILGIADQVIDGVSTLFG